MSNPVSTDQRQSGLLPVSRLKWAGRKLLALFVIYVAVGSLYRSVNADATIATTVYLLAGIVGLYLLFNW